MKTRNLLTFLLLLGAFFVSCSNKKEMANPDEIVIIGHIEGLRDGALVSLGEYDQSYQTNFSTVRDTTKNNSFKIVIKDSTKITRLHSLGLIIDDKSLPIIDFWAKSGTTIYFTGKGEIPALWFAESDMDEQKQQNKFTKLTSKLKAQVIKIDEENSKIYDELHQTQIEPSKKEELKKRRATLDSTRSSIFQEIKTIELKTLEKTSPNAFWIYKLRELANSYNIDLKTSEEEPRLDIGRLTSLYNKLDDEQKNSTRGQEIYKLLFPPKPVTIGDKMADGDLLDMDGNKIRLSDYTDRYRLLDFWSIGCGACIAMMPELEKVAEEYQDKLTVISINCDSEKFWKNFSTHKSDYMKNLLDPLGRLGFNQQYGVKGWPTLVLIGPDDTILDSWIGGGSNKLRSKVKEFVK